MKMYKVIAHSVTIRSGVIGLSPLQARDRAHALKQIDYDLYEVLAPAQFKQGEKFAYDGDTNKALLQHIQPVGEEPEKAEEESGAGESTGNDATGEQEGEGETTTPPVTTTQHAGRKNRGR